MKKKNNHSLCAPLLAVPLWAFINLCDCCLPPQVCAPPLTWMRTAHACSRGRLRLSLDTASCSTSGADGDGEEDTRGPWGRARGGALGRRERRCKWRGLRTCDAHAFSLRPASGVTFGRCLDSCPPPRMLVGAPWDGPSGDRRGDVYRCPVGGSHSAPCAKGHLGKEMPRSSTPDP